MRNAAQLLLKFCLIDRHNVESFIIFARVEVPYKFSKNGNKSLCYIIYALGMCPYARNSKGL